MKSITPMAALCSLLVASAPATVLLNEPFSTADYSAGTVKSQMDNVATNGNVGFTYDRKWSASNTGVVFVHADGLDFGRKMPDFHGTGLSAGWNYKKNSSNGDGARGVFRQTADGVIPRSGVYFFRCLARESSGALWYGNKKWHRRVGFQQVGFDGSGNTTDYWVAYPSTGPNFSFEPKPTGNGYSAGASVLKFHFNDVDVTLVDPVVQGATYLCLAKIEIGAGADGTDLASALIVPVDAWDWNGKGEPAWGVERGDTGWKLATTPYYGDKFQLYGAFETGSVPVAFDEVMLATEIADVVGPSPAKGTVILIK